MKKKRKVKGKVLERIVSKEKICYFCGTEKDLTKHHIIPKELLKFAKPYNHTIGETEWLCDDCHKKLHKLLTPVIRFLLKAFEEWYKKQQPKPTRKIGFRITNGKKKEKFKVCWETKLQGGGERDVNGKS